MGGSTGTHDGSPPSVRVALFRSGGLLCGLPIADLEEVLPTVALHRPPGTPPLVHGYLNLADAVVPVLDFGALMRAPSVDVTDPTVHLILLRHDDGPIALAVERVLRIEDIAADAILPLVAEHHSSGAIAGIAHDVCPEGAMQMLSVQHLLLESERQVLRQQRAALQHRLAGLAGGTTTP